MYLLYLDESGTHASSPYLVLGGIALHEDDAWWLQRGLSDLVAQVVPGGRDPLEFELHAAEMKEPRRVRLNAAKRGKVKISPWESVADRRRFWAMHETYRTLANYTPRNAAFPVCAFGVIVEKSYADYLERAYEEILHRFDEMLTRLAHGAGAGVHQRGIVVHDKHVIERDLQQWANTWRRVAGRIGLLTHMADVPFFADSRASRLLQAADFTSWAIWRNYVPGDAKWISYLWPHFDGHGGRMHGLVHVHRTFRACSCPPCLTRRLAVR